MTLMFLYLQAIYKARVDAQFAHRSMRPSRVPPVEEDQDPLALRLGPGGKCYIYLFIFHFFTFSFRYRVLTCMFNRTF